MGIGAIMGAVGGNLASSLIDHNLAMRRQKQAQGFEADMYQQRYQMTVRDLQAAGLNPMLAYTQGVGPAPSSSAASVSHSNLGSAAVEADNSTRIASAQEALLRAQKRNTEADTALKSVTAEKASKESDIKGPRAVIMRVVEDVLKGFVGTSASRESNRQRNTQGIRDFFGRFTK